MSESVTTSPVRPTDATGIGTAELVAGLRALRRAALELEELCAGDLGAVSVENRPSARNLVHYLAVRQHDLRPIQHELAARGLSSLGRAEAHVLATIDAVLGHLGAPPDVTDTNHRAPPSAAESVALLERHTLAALGPLLPGEQVRLMVTLPSEAAEDPALVDDLVAAGMSLARINCAHDGPDEWRRMAAAARAAGRAHGREVRISCNLAGPKLRTRPLEEGPRVVKLRPDRAADGRVQQPVRVRFVGPIVAPSVPSPGRMVVVPVDAALVESAAVDDELRLRDARGRRRRLRITSVWAGAVEATSDRTSYLVPGLEVRLCRDGRIVTTGRVRDLAPVDAFLRVERGDPLRVRCGHAVGTPAVRDDDGRVVSPATIFCEIPELFSAIAVGDRLLLDDGTIEAVVDVVDRDMFEVTIVRPERAKLRAEKGINLPDTDLRVPALTADDCEALATVTPIADLVALSFVGGVDDIVALTEVLDELDCPDTTIILKIEHASAFRALPEMLLQALRGRPFAVMLARGDLAVELGFERLAEVQEEILWLCEAAHLPVIWATQVLESLAKGGVPTRAEVTDAAWAVRAECVMLNKGPHIVSAMRFLTDVLARMHEHQDKRTPMLRQLSVAHAFGDQVHDRSR